MTDEPASGQHSPWPDTGSQPQAAGSATFKSLMSKLLRLFEIQSHLIGLRFALTMREVLLTAMLVVGGVLLLLLGLVFLYVAVFKGLLLVMGPIEVCLIFAAFHMLGALVILLMIQSRRKSVGTTAATPAANSGGSR
ncbi:MAG: hypothetical protein HKL95_09060 [Phycisphaerae bacterium]|nr:hypothetical protein [Phycisphaerae bacterium]